MNDLFTDEFPVVNTQEELENVKKEYNHYDDYYVVSGCIPERKTKFNQLWSIYEPYADKHFLHQIKYNFHARTWEMYLGNIFLLNKLDIETLDNGPDIKIKSFYKPIFVEATVANKGDGIDAVPEPLYNIGAMDVPHDQMLMRLTSSLKYKFEKYEKYIGNSIISKDDSFIIAINRGSLEHPDTDIPLILKALFSIGYLAIKHPIGEPHGDKTETFLTRRQDVGKIGGNKIPLNFFEDKSHAGISAVIYSTKDVLNHPEETGSDCILVHNPNAKNPIDLNDFNFFKQWVLENNHLKMI